MEQLAVQNYSAFIGSAEVTQGVKQVWAVAVGLGQGWYFQTDSLIIMTTSNPPIQNYFLVLKRCFGTMRVLQKMRSFGSRAGSRHFSKLRINLAHVLRSCLGLRSGKSLLTSILAVTANHPEIL